MGNTSSAKLEQSNTYDTTGVVFKKNGYNRYRPTAIVAGPMRSVTSVQQESQIPIRTQTVPTVIDYDTSSSSSSDDDDYKFRGRSCSKRAGPFNNAWRLQELLKVPAVKKIVNKYHLAHRKDEICGVLKAIENDKNEYSPQSPSSPSSSKLHSILTDEKLVGGRSTLFDSMTGGGMLLSPKDGCELKTEVQIKKELKKKGLSVKGNKKELCKRLTGHIKSILPANLKKMTKLPNLSEYLDFFGSYQLWYDEDIVFRTICLQNPTLLPIRIKKLSEKIDKAVIQMFLSLTPERRIDFSTKLFNMAENLRVHGATSVEQTTEMIRCVINDFIRMDAPVEPFDENKECTEYSSEELMKIAKRYLIDVDRQYLSTAELCKMIRERANDDKTKEIKKQLVEMGAFTHTTSASLSETNRYVLYTICRHLEHIGVASNELKKLSGNVLQFMKNTAGVSVLMTNKRNMYQKNMDYEIFESQQKLLKLNQFMAMAKSRSLVGYSFSPDELQEITNKERELEKTKEMILNLIYRNRAEQFEMEQIMKSSMRSSGPPPVTRVSSFPTVTRLQSRSPPVTRVPSWSPLRPSVSSQSQNQSSINNENHRLLMNDLKRRENIARLDLEEEERRVNSIIASRNKGEFRFNNDQQYQNQKKKLRHVETKLEEKYPESPRRFRFNNDEQYQDQKKRLRPVPTIYTRTMEENNKKRAERKGRVDQSENYSGIADLYSEKTKKENDTDSDSDSDEEKGNLANIRSQLVSAGLNKGGYKIHGGVPSSPEPETPEPPQLNLSYPSTIGRRQNGEMNRQLENQRKRIENYNNPRYDVYRNLLKSGVSWESVKTKMQQEGYNPGVIDSRTTHSIKDISNNEKRKSDSMLAYQNFQYFKH